MAATDQRSAAVVEMPLLGEAAFRIHIKHVSTVLSFLNGMGTDDVAVHTHDRCVFFVRADGALLGESRPLVQFPKFKTPKGKDQRYWVLGAAEVRNAVAFLQAGAAEEDIRLLFTRPEKDGPVVLSMLNLTGTRTQYPLTCAEAGEVDDVAPFPDSGFVVARDPFLSLLDAAEGDFVRLGVNLKPKKNTGGYLRHMVERFGADGEDEADSAKADTYVTVLPWLR